mmetsp:Transcript_17763/g.46834  ORF Transcript_17763/g.46834 Transcript_17763/m.46834 type:complete len:234 (-) Transcript_17763:455-1156(-)
MAPAVLVAPRVGGRQLDRVLLHEARFTLRRWLRSGALGERVHLQLALRVEGNEDVREAIAVDVAHRRRADGAGRVADVTGRVAPRAAPFARRREQRNEAAVVTRQQHVWPRARRATSLRPEGDDFAGRALRVGAGARQERGLRHETGREHVPRPVGARLRRLLEAKDAAFAVGALVVLIVRHEQIEPSVHVQIERLDREKGARDVVDHRSHHIRLVAQAPLGCRASVEAEQLS